MANTKQTSKSVATKAAKILNDNRFSKTSKSVAGSALAQTKKANKPFQTNGHRVTVRSTVLLSLPIRPFESAKIHAKGRPRYVWSFILRFSRPLGSAGACPSAADAAYSCKRAGKFSHANEPYSL